MHTRSRAWMVALLLAVPAGACRKPKNAAIGVTVEVNPLLKVNCVKLAIQPTDGPEWLTEGAVRVDGKHEVNFAIYPDVLTSDVTLVARGYVGEGCSGLLQLNSASAPETRSFKRGQVEKVTLKLDPPTKEEDGDGDGYRSSALGGPDCSDRLDTVHPGATENCAAGIDNNCNGKLGCDDLVTCIGQVCGPNNMRCQTAAVDALNKTTALNCSVPEICHNGVNDDADDVADCLDPDCENQSCNDGIPCRTDEHCTNKVCVANQFDPRGCDGAGGICKPDGTCTKLPYSNPSTFIRTQFGPVGPPVTVSCALTLDTSADPDGGYTWCPGQAAPALQVQGNSLVVVTEALDIAPSAVLTVGGTRSLVFAVFGPATVQGEVRLSANLAVGPNQCAGGAGADGLDGGGGGGGSLQARGGNGGLGSDLGSVAGSGGDGGASFFLRGGCPGGSGGNGGGAGGAGGGAFQISAATLDVSGTISAHGGGGAAGTALGTGGGGGGSGGYIILEGSPVRIASTASITAHGGGGGGAGDGLLAAAGGNGASAGGGSGGASSVGAGGAGASAGGGLAGSAGLDGGGGGGGGSAGLIRIQSSPSPCQRSDGGVVSPNASGCP